MYDWSWENNINSSRELIDIDQPQEHNYNAWRTNTSLSSFRETILHANQVNLNYHLPDKLQYHYLFYSVRKQKRYGKRKTDEDKRLEAEQKAYSELIQLVQEYYKYSVENAKQALKVLNKEQIDIIKKKQEKGG